MTEKPKKKDFTLYCVDTINNKRFTFRCRNRMLKVLDNGALEISEWEEYQAPKIVFHTPAGKWISWGVFYNSAVYPHEYK